MRTIALALLLLSSPSLAATDKLPEPVGNMIRAAVATGDSAQVDTVVKLAKATNPEATAEIDHLVEQLSAEQEKREEKRLLEAAFFDNWSGSGELGGSVATGNSDTVTLAAGLKLQRDGLRWRHTFNAVADIQRSDGENTQERLAANYQANWRVSERFYLLGRVGWERNRSADLLSRFTEALGAGYRIIDGSRVTWDAEAGPALSQSRFVGYTENQLAGRIATNFRWELSSDTVFTEDASALLQSGSSSLLSTTALTTKLMGALSMRLSFTAQHETNPPNPRKKTDTVSRVTLVYDF